MTPRSWDVTAPGRNGRGRSNTERLMVTLQASVEAVARWRVRGQTIVALVQEIPHLEAVRVRAASLLANGRTAAGRRWVLPMREGSRRWSGRRQVLDDDGPDIVRELGFTGPGLGEIDGLLVVVEELSPVERTLQRRPPGSSPKGVWPLPRPGDGSSRRTLKAIAPRTKFVTGRATVMPLRVPDGLFPHPSRHALHFAFVVASEPGAPLSSSRVFAADYPAKQSRCPAHTGPGCTHVKSTRNAATAPSIDGHATVS